MKNIEFPILAALFLILTLSVFSPKTKQPPSNHFISVCKSLNGKITDGNDVDPLGYTCSYKRVRI